MAVRKTVESKEISLNAHVEETQIGKPGEKQIAKKHLRVAIEEHGPVPAGGTSTDRAARENATSTVTDGESG